MKFSAELLVSLMFQCAAGARREICYQCLVHRVQFRQSTGPAENDIERTQTNFRGEPIRFAFWIKWPAVTSEMNRRYFRQWLFCVLGQRKVHSDRSFSRDALRSPLPPTFSDAQKVFVQFVHCACNGTIGLVRPELVRGLP